MAEKNIIVTRGIPVAPPSMGKASGGGVGSFTFSAGAYGLSGGTSRSSMDVMDMALEEAFLLGDGWPSMEAYHDLGIYHWDVLPYQIMEARMRIADQYESKRKALERVLRNELSMVVPERSVEGLGRSIARLDIFIEKNIESLAASNKRLAGLPNHDLSLRNIDHIVADLVQLDESAIPGAIDQELDLLKTLLDIDVTTSALEVLRARRRLLQSQMDDLHIARSANTFAASGSSALSGPLVTVVGGTLDAVQGAAGSLENALRSAVAQALRVLAGGLGSSVATFATLALYSSKLGNGERYSLSAPLSDVSANNGQDLQTIALAEGEVELSVRISTRTVGELSTMFVTPTRGMVPSKVKVRLAQFDKHSNRYSFTTTDSPPRTLTWTPAVFPQDNSTDLPAEQPASAIYPGLEVEPIEVQLEVYPGVAEASFDDYIIIFPADSGMAPIYVMFKDRREDPGVATGNGQVISGRWLEPGIRTRGAAIPSQIAEQLRGREFRSFRQFREIFWKTVASDVELAAQFESNLLGLMHEGHSPIVSNFEQVGRRIKFELHHVKYISAGGGVYDLDNIVVVTPRMHLEMHKEAQE